MRGHNMISKKHLALIISSLIIIGGLFVYKKRYALQRIVLCKIFRNQSHKKFQEHKQQLRSLTEPYSLDNDVDLERLACLMFTLQVDQEFIEKLVAFAANIAQQRSSDLISAKDFDTAWVTLKYGEELPQKDPQTALVSAIHVAGSALICALLSPNDLYHVTIARHANRVKNGFGGYTQRICKPDDMSNEKNIRNYIIMTLGAIASEAVILDTMTSHDYSNIPLQDGSDLAEAYKKALGLIILQGNLDQDLIQATSIDELPELAQEAAPRIKEILQECQLQAVELIKNNKEKLIKLTNALVEHKTLTGSQVLELLGLQKEAAQQHN